MNLSVTEDTFYTEVKLIYIILMENSFRTNKKCPNCTLLGGVFITHNICSPYKASQRSHIAVTFTLVVCVSYKVIKYVTKLI